MRISARFVIKNNCGTITLEAAFLMPVFIGIMLFFISLMQIAAAENVFKLSLIRTADNMAKWAPIYRNIIADNIHQDILSELGSNMEKNMKLEIASFIGSMIQLRKIGETSFDYIYSTAADFMCNGFIQENTLVKNNFINIKDINLYKSNFFPNSSDDIYLNAAYSVKTYLPVKIKREYSVRCMAWGNGKMPYVIMEGDSLGISVWKEDNFTRGNILRHIFGANLPDNFPVIAIWENNMATMIKSINHTAPTYSSSYDLRKAIINMLNELERFKGDKLGNIEIREKDIKMKRLILIMPEDEMTKLQETVLLEVRQYAMSKFIILDLQRYQKV